MFNDLVAFFTCFVVVSIWLSIWCSIWCSICNDRHEDEDSLAEDADDDNDLAFELECMGNPNVEVKISYIIMTLNL